MKKYIMICLFLQTVLNLYASQTNERIKLDSVTEFLESNTQEAIDPYVQRSEDTSPLFYQSNVPSMPYDRSSSALNFDLAASASPSPNHLDYYKELFRQSRNLNDFDNLKQQFLSLKNDERVGINYRQRSRMYQQLLYEEVKQDVMLNNNSFVKQFIKSSLINDLSKEQIVDLMHATKSEEIFSMLLRSTKDFSLLEKVLHNYKVAFNFEDYQNKIFREILRDVRSENKEFVRNFVQSQLVHNLSAKHFLYLIDISSDPEIAQMLKIASEDFDNLEKSLLQESQKDYHVYRDLLYLAIRKVVTDANAERVERFVRGFLIDDLSNDQLLRLLNVAPTEKIFDMLMAEFQSRNMNVSLINNEQLPSKTKNFRKYYQVA